MHSFCIYICFWLPCMCSSQSYVTNRALSDKTCKKNKKRFFIIIVLTGNELSQKGNKEIVFLILGFEMMTDAECEMMTDAEKTQNARNYVTITTALSS